MGNVKINKIDVKSYGVQCRCNAVMKSLSILMLQRLGYNVSSAYSRFASDKGLVSLYDKETLGIIQEITNLVARFSYRFQMPDAVAKDMMELRSKWLDLLTGIADDVEAGAEPVYCQTLGQWEQDPDELGDYDLLKRYILCRTIGRCSSLTDMQKGYATGALRKEDEAEIKKHLEGASKAEQKVYIKTHLDLSNEQVEELQGLLTEASIKEITAEFMQVMSNIESEKNEKLRRSKYKAFNNAYFIPYLDRWSFRVPYTKKHSNSLFIRNKIEFIYDIPNKTDDALRSMLHNNIIVLEDFKVKRKAFTDEIKMLWPLRYRPDAGQRIDEIQRQAVELYHDVVDKLTWPEPQSECQSE